MSDLTRQQQEALAAAMYDALNEAYSAIEQLDQDAAGDVLDLQQQTLSVVQAAINAATDASGAVPVYQVQRVVGQVNLALEQLRAQQEQLVVRRVGDAATSGSGVIPQLRKAAAGGHFPEASISRLPDPKAAAADVAQQIVHNIAEDGLQLSDRIWRINTALRDELVGGIQSAIIRGDAAASAARGALISSGAATAEQIDQIQMAKAGALGKQASEILVGDQSRAYADTLRVMRTEIDNANIMATRSAMYATEGLVATKVVLSPAHPRTDICDMYAGGNFYGLGKGVYPKGKSPIPAHPNTLTREEAVFIWEVDHTAERDDPISWLQAQPEQHQADILQSTNKVQALRQGLLQPEDITRPWRQIQVKYSGQLQTE